MKKNRLIEIDEQRNEIKFEKLPIWNGVQNNPGIDSFLEFRLGWDQGGFIRQTTPEEVLREFTEGYSKQDYNPLNTRPGESSYGSRRGDGFAAFIRQCYPDLEGRNVMEIGAGTLYVAEKLITEDKVANYLVVDPSLKDVPARKNINVTRGYFDENTGPDAYFDVIANMNCFEHIPDPASFLANTRRKLNPAGGRAVLLFPNDGKRLVEGNFNALIHEHVCFYSEESVSNLMKKCGLDVVQCETRFDVMCVSAKVADAKDTKAAEDNGIIEIIGNRLIENLESLNNYLVESHAQGKRIAFHGANAGLNNVLALTGFDRSDNILLYDGDEKKTGHYIPACKNAILHSSDRSYAKVDAVVVAATEFYDEIKEYLISFHNIDAGKIKYIYELDR